MAYAQAFEVNKQGTARIVPVNDNGVIGRNTNIGSHFVASDGKRTMFVPMICFSCRNYDPGEYGDYGSKLSPAYCEANVWWPTRKGTCKKYRGYNGS